ncbi:MAG: polyribonucleotide nucleotidyltransferase [Rhabdochlamydiaceae bacterium]
MFKTESVSVFVGNAEISFETGKIARQANGAVTVKSGDTILLCTACANQKVDDNIDFFPLRVDYQEKFSSAGKTLGGFLKREGRPTEKETLVSRLIDRPLRPMFEDGYFNEVQLLSYVLSYESSHLPEPLAICGCSAALAISDIPLIKPVAGVRVAFIDNQFVINPSLKQQEASKLDLMIAGTEDAILMIEGYCDFLTEAQVIQAVEEGHTAIKLICQAIAELQRKAGKEKNKGELKTPSEALLKEIDQLIGEQLKEAFKIRAKGEREIALEKISKSVKDTFAEKTEPLYNPILVGFALKKLKAQYMREMILSDNIRSDGRSTTDIRVIDVEQGLLPRTHGSTLFTRGETQTIAVCTLGGSNNGQRYEDLNSDKTTRFFLQYSFPPFSVGEVGRIGSPGRREIGHGKLAERALSMIVPHEDKFPYTIRLESNITESNGSSSMASVCGGCLAMMDAGVPIKKPIAGIAMGLILENSRFAILSDILGAEDALGDMDFKIAGDAEGITAFQLDIKIEGITIEIMKLAIAQAVKGLTHILGKMLEKCPKTKDHLSAYAPRIEKLQIKSSKIGTVIGPGGKQIRAIIEETGVEVDIDDNGVVSLSSSNQENMNKAKKIILDLVSEVEVNKIYTGKVVSIEKYGVFVEICGKKGLCHISELSYQRVNDIQKEVCKISDSLEVKVMDINERGQIDLSRKVLLPKPEKPVQDNLSQNA